MAQDMKRIEFNHKSRCRVLHIEVPGAIINIRRGLCDTKGNEITSIEILRDTSCRSDEDPDREWRFMDFKKSDALNVRVGLVLLPKGKRIKPLK